MTPAPIKDAQKDTKAAHRPRNARDVLRANQAEALTEGERHTTNRLKEQALNRLSHSGAPHSVNILMTKCHHHIATRMGDTMFVQLFADNTAMLGINPDFIKRLSPEGAAFVLFHESRHLIYRHLFRGTEFAGDPAWTLATEATINHVAKARLGGKLPSLQKLDANGELLFDQFGAPVWEDKPTGVDPQEVYDRYVADLSKQGLTPISYDAMFKTDLACFNELKRMKDDPQNNSAAGGEMCEHGSPGAPGDDGNGSDAEAEALKDMVEKTISSLVHQARRGDENARAEVTELADRTDGMSDDIDQMWGSLGVNKLRGRTTATKRVDWWKRWLNDAIASRIVEGERLEYNRKRGAVDLLLGMDPILSRRGDDEEKVVLVAIDTSGSMPQTVIDYLAELVGFTDGVKFHWVAFDGDVIPFVPGGDIAGGGGTDFGNVMRYAEGDLEVNGERLSTHPDAVVMVTDGWADPISPAQPDKWVWLLTHPRGGEWLHAHKPSMSHHVIETV